MNEFVDRWELPFGGMRVTQIKIDYQLTLVLDGGAEVQLESEARLLRSGAEVARLDPGSQDVGAALGLFGAEMLSAAAFKDGVLRLCFGGGAELTIEPDAAYEAWNVRGPGGLMLVCQPGGEVALWS